MRRAACVGLVVLGAATAVYGVASVTGGWLGTPPWWERDVSTEEFIESRWGVVLASPPITADRTISMEREGRGATSGAVMAAGLALVAVGAWSRRRQGPRLVTRPSIRAGCPPGHG